MNPSGLESSNTHKNPLCDLLFCRYNTVLVIWQVFNHYFQLFIQQTFTKYLLYVMHCDNHTHTHAFVYTNTHAYMYTLTHVHVSAHLHPTLRFRKMKVR